MIERGEYNGHKTIMIYSDKDTAKKYKPFTFGVSKAKLILSHLKEIQEFVKENEKEV